MDDSICFRGTPNLGNLHFGDGLKPIIFGGWTSIYQQFWGQKGYQGFEPYSRWWMQYLLFWDGIIGCRKKGLCLTGTAEEGPVDFDSISIDTFNNEHHVQGLPYWIKATYIKNNVPLGPPAAGNSHLMSSIHHVRIRWFLPCVCMKLAKVAHFLWSLESLEACKCAAVYINDHRTYRYL